MDQDLSKTVNYILKLAVTVLAGIIAIVSLALVVGLFISNDVVDNTKVFEVLTPAFNTVIGAFVGLLGGLSIGNNGSVSLKQEPPPAAPTPPPAPTVVAPAPIAPAPTVSVPTLNTVVVPAPVVAAATVATPTVMSSEVVAGFGGKPAPVQPDHPEI